MAGSVIPTWVFAALAELSYRKDVDDYQIRFDWLEENVNLTAFDFEGLHLAALNSEAAKLGLINFESGLLWAFIAFGPEA